MLWTESVLIFLWKEKKVRVVVVVEAHAVYCKILELEDIKMDAFTFTFFCFEMKLKISSFCDFAHHPER